MPTTVCKVRLLLHSIPHGLGVPWTGHPHPRASWHLLILQGVHTFVPLPSCAHGPEGPSPSHLGKSSLPLKTEPVGHPCSAFSLQPLQPPDPRPPHSRPFRADGRRVSAASSDARAASDTKEAPRECVQLPDWHGVGGPLPGSDPAQQARLHLFSPLRP